jgi:hypothetical protein
VIDGHTAAVVGDIFRREGRSFLQYLSDSLPWPTADGDEVQARLGPLVAEAQAATAQLGQYLTRHHLPLPYLGSYPAAFTQRNFVCFSHLVPVLLDELRASMPPVESAIATVPDPEARELLQKLLHTKRLHVQALEGRTAVTAVAAGAH